jgi:hypothetical protein
MLLLSFAEEPLPHNRYLKQVVRSLRIK